MAALHPFEPALDLPLGKVPGLSDSARQRELIAQLAELSVSDFEQLAGLLSVEATRGKAAATLRLGNAELLGLYMSARMKLGPAATASVTPSPRQWPIGADFDPDQGAELAKTVDSLTPIRPGQKGLPRLYHDPYLLSPDKSGKSLSWIRHLPAVRDQGTRATSPAFALTTANELLRRQLGKEAELSEQFLFYEAKQLDAAASRTGETTSLAACATVLLRNGQCRRNSWPYLATGATANHGTKPLNARSEAGNFRCRPQLVPATPAEVTSALDGGSLVVLLIPVFASWLHSPEVARAGRLTLPLLGEDPLGYHALTLIGYDATHFFARNSWGAEWAPHSPIAPGYGTLPFSYLSLAAEAYSLLAGT